jgi:hypothetical protein
MQDNQVQSEREYKNNPLGAWMFVCCECRVLSGRGLCDGPITQVIKSTTPEWEAEALISCRILIRQLIYGSADANRIINKVVDIVSNMERAWQVCYSHNNLL